MGLDIYFHKTKATFEGDKNNHSDLRAFTDKADEFRQQELAKKVKKPMAELKRLWDEAHYTDEETGEIYTYEAYLADYDLKYFEFVVKVLLPGIGKNFRWLVNDYTETVLPYPELEKVIKRQINQAYVLYDAYFRRAWFILDYFKNKGKILDDWFIFVTKEDVDDLIYRCEKVLKNHKRAYSLLPDPDADYDEGYFEKVNDCLRQMKKYRKLLKDGVTGYVTFSR